MAKQTELPTLKKSFKRLPDLAVLQLRASMDNINRIYGLGFKAHGFEVMGTLTSDDDCREARQWILANAVMPYGDLTRPQNIKVANLADIPDRSKADQETFETCLAERIAVGDQAVVMKFEDEAFGAFKTIAVVDNEGIKYDSMLFGIYNVSQGQPESGSGNTDCEWWRFGWIWQSGFNNMTRGEVKICLSVLCNNAGRAVGCNFSRSCFMQLGSCNTTITPPAAAGRCCTATCSWGVATGTVTVTVTGGAITFSGTFGSTSSGGRSLRDCCRPPAVVPTSAAGAPAASTADETASRGVCYSSSDCRGSVLGRNVTLSECFGLGGTSWQSGATGKCQNFIPYQRPDRLRNILDGLGETLADLGRWLSGRR